MEIITANEAREISNKNIIENKMYKDSMRCIKEAAQKGEYNCTSLFYGLEYEKKLREVAKQLKNLGYKIKVDYEYNCFTYTGCVDYVFLEISWE